MTDIPFYFYTHNPVSYLKKWIEGYSTEALEAEGYYHGSYDIDLVEGIRFRLGFNSVTFSPAVSATSLSHFMMLTSLLPRENPH